MGNFIKKIICCIQAERDARHLIRTFPQLGDYEKTTEKDPYHLKRAYDMYTTAISSKDMAISWETSCFLYTISRILGAKAVLDLGSGFSSYVLRLYCLRNQDVYGSEIVVYSIDDNDFWLAKTESFLCEQGVPVNHLHSWEYFCEMNKPKFDLIFYDLGNMKTRIRCLPYVLELIHGDGVIIFDDMHKKMYRQVLTTEVKKRGLSLHSAKKFTLDDHGRFSGLAKYNPNPKDDFF